MNGRRGLPPHGEEWLLDWGRSKEEVARVSSSNCKDERLERHHLRARCFGLEPSSIMATEKHVINDVVIGVKVKFQKRKTS